MLEGLEISEVNCSKIESDGKKRLDSDFFKKKYVIATNKITKRDYYLFIDLIEKLTDFHANGSYETIAKFFTLLDFKNYAYMLRTVDLEADNYTENVKYVDKNCYYSLKKSKLFGKELIINKIGNPGRTYLVPSLKVPMSLGMNLFMVTLKKNSDINTDFLYVYFNIEIGKNIIQRQVNGTVPLTIDKNSIKCLLIPKFSKVFYDYISVLVRNLEIFKSNSKTLYQQAEDILLEELGLTNFIPTQQAVNIKSIKESFEATGRLDAEYYQPKYEEVIVKLKEYSHGFSYLKDFIKNFSTGYPYQSNTYLESDGVPLIRINNIYKGYIDISNCAYIPQKDFLLSPKDIAKEDDILISMSGTIGNVCTIPKGITAVINQRIMRITLKNYDNQVITLFINSIVGSIQLERIGTGGVQTNISANDIQNILIPNLSIEKQQEISALIQESFALKSQSEQLLTIAKQAVEMAIEFDEETAMQFIKENTNNIDLVN